MTLLTIRKWMLLVVSVVVCVLAKEPSQFKCGKKASWMLRKEILKSEIQNQIMSTWSVNVLLSYLYSQSCDKSIARNQLSLIIEDCHRNLNNRNHLLRNRIVGSNYQKALKSLNSICFKDGNCTIQTQNALFVHRNVQNRFLVNGVDEKKFNVQVEEVDFSNLWETVDKVNNFVEYSTNGVIKDIINEDDLVGSDYVLLNTIYFKANWLFKFNKFNFPFLNDRRQQTKIQGMKVTEEFEYNKVNELKAQVIRIPYTNAKLSMIIILPYENSTLKYVSSKLNTKSWQRVINSLYYHKVRIVMPKFKIEYKMDLEKIIKKMGISSIFEPNSGLYYDLTINKIVQKAVINVDREGTEAAAATAMVASRSATQPIEEMIINRPFLYFIVANNEILNNEILFSGKYMNP